MADLEKIENHMDYIISGCECTPELEREEKYCREYIAGCEEFSLLTPNEAAHLLEALEKLVMIRRTVLRLQRERRERDNW